MAILALILTFGVPALLAYLVALFIYIRLLKSGNNHARRNRIIIFVVIFILLSIGSISVLLDGLSFDR